MIIDQNSRLSHKFIGFGDKKFNFDCNDGINFVDKSAQWAWKMLQHVKERKIRLCKQLVLLEYLLSPSNIDSKNGQISLIPAKTFKYSPDVKNPYD